MRAGQFVATFILAALPFAALAQDAPQDGQQVAPPDAPPVVSHDGLWRVDIQTTVGKCAPSGTAVVTVKDDRVTGIDASGVTPWGYIDETNTFVGHFIDGEKVLHANGSVKGEFAEGPWSSQTEFCGGRWTARKLY